MSWQRWLRTALGLFLVALVLVVALTMRRRAPQPAVDTVKRIDPSAAVELPQGADIVWTEKGREVFTLKFQRALTYPDGRSVFSGADVRIPDRGGRTVLVSAADAEVRNAPGQPRSVVLRGNVVLRSSDGLTLNSRDATYSEQDRILRIPGAFTFTRARTSGSGTGATYDQNAAVFVVREDARMKIAPDADGSDAMEIAAGSATMDRTQHLVRFEQHATVLAGTQTTEAETLVAYLTGDDERLTRVELRGGSRVRDESAAAGGLRAMEARDINLAYAPDGRTVQRAELRGQSVLELAGSGGAGRRLAAETIDADLGADGRTLQQLTASERVQLDLPQEGDAPARRIRSRSLSGAGDTGGLRDVTFIGSVEYHESRAARGRTAAVDRTARSDRLDATLKPGFGAPEHAIFRGRAAIRDGQTTGEAGVADYAPGRNLMTLETPAGIPGPTPRVADDQVSVSAAWIEMTLAPRRLHAKGDVRSIISSGHKEKGNRQDAENARRRPAMLNDSDPINVTAQELQYDADASRGTYTGTARLWQGDTTLQGDTLVLDDKAGNLSASKRVRTRMMLEQVDDKTREKKPIESIGSSDEFAYEDAARRATYTGAAHLTGPQGDITAKKIELFLDADGRTLDRADAYDEVVARLEGGQRASGTRLTYFSGDGRYVMTGTPVKILETVEGGCRETLGAALTFVRSTDTISVVGTEGNRSRTMPGRCAER